MQPTPPVYGPVGDEDAVSPIRVDWKAGFSAERTFMAWMHMVVTLTTIALALIASEQTRGTGLLLLVPAAVFLLWATISFYRRSYALSQKTMPALEDATGPALVLIVMTLVICINVLNAWTQALSEDSLIGVQPDEEP
mmetsp:Transcript_40666/g.92216  ORF Transcript_40666/g.92216 Transcript_40666/m.92216 type:complete len:138 (-) Transcript_40666:236-649(-)